MDCWVFVVCSCLLVRLVGLDLTCVGDWLIFLGVVIAGVFVTLTAYLRIWGWWHLCLLLIMLTLCI